MIYFLHSVRTYVSSGTKYQSVVPQAFLTKGSLVKVALEGLHGYNSLMYPSKATFAWLLYVGNLDVPVHFVPEHCTSGFPHKVASQRHAQKMAMRISINSSAGCVDASFKSATGNRFPCLTSKAERQKQDDSLLLSMGLQHVPCILMS